MIHETIPIKVPPASELARALDAADHAPVLLEKDGVLYRVNRVQEDDLWVGYDPAAVRAAIAAAAGSWADIDPDELKARLARAREALTE